MSRFLIISAFSAFILLGGMAFSQQKPDKEDKLKLTKERQKIVKDKIQKDFVEAYDMDMDEFFAKISSASNGARLLSVQSNPFTCVSASQSPAPPAPSQTQYQALLDLYTNAGGTNWVNKAGWQNAPATAIPVHNWAGVCVNAQGNIIGLDLAGFGLTGSLPASFWNLTSLLYLNLEGNDLSGSIPPTVSNLSQLQYFNLRSNNFTGSLHSNLGNISSLVSINFDGNNFSGSIPSQLGNLGNLSELILSNNEFTGVIPSNLSNASNLVVLNLSYNPTLSSGSIPFSFGNLSNLGALLLVSCNLTGPIPSSFSNLSSIQDLYLTNNNLNNSIPDGLGLLQYLRILELGQNSLSGPIPSDIFLSSSIEFLHLYNNVLTGGLEGIGNMTAIKSIVLYSNQLSGNLPVAFESLTGLSVINLAYNGFSGVVPPNFLCGSVNKTEVRLDNNPNLSGKLSSCLRYTSGNVNISNGGFTFSDFLHLVGPIPESRLTYTPQGLVGSNVSQSERVGFPHVFTATVDRLTEPRSKFRWYKMVNGVETPVQSEFSEANYVYKIQHLTSGDFGTYFYKIINDKAGALTLKSRNYVLNQNTASLGTIGIDAFDVYCAVAFELDPNLIPGCQPISASWNFGDGGSSLRENPLHAYGSSGTFQVSVNVNFVCGESIVFTYTANKSIPFYPSEIGSEMMVDRTITTTTKGTTRVLDASFQTYSDSWNRSLSSDAESLNSFRNGKQGIWGAKTGYFYDDQRSYSQNLDLSVDGAFELKGFSYEYANYDVVPGFVKAGEVTGLSEQGFFDETVDALGIYSTQMFGYEGGAVIASAVNARESEIMTVDFENLNDPSAGNWILGESVRTSRGRRLRASVTASGPYTLTVATPRSAISDFDQVTLSVASGRTGGRSLASWITNVPIICMQANPLNANETILVLDVENEILDRTQTAIFTVGLSTPRLLTFDNQFAHSGKRSMKFTLASESITQDLVQLVPLKEYTFSAWISDKQISATPIGDVNQFIEVRFESKTGTLISSQKFYPMVQTSEAWRKVMGNFVPPAGTERITLSFSKGASTSIWIDDIRIHPAESQLQTYVYELNSLRISAVLDAENYATFYFYDEEGKLKLLKKETQSGIVTITEVQDFLVPNPSGVVNY